MKARLYYVARVHGGEVHLLSGPFLSYIDALNHIKVNRYFTNPEIVEQEIEVSE